MENVSKQLETFEKIGIYCDVFSPISNFSNCIKNCSFLYSFNIGVLEYFLGDENPYSEIKPFLSVPIYKTKEDAYLSGIEEIKIRYKDYINSKL